MIFFVMLVYQSFLLLFAYSLFYSRIWVTILQSIIGYAIQNWNLKLKHQKKAFLSVFLMALKCIMIIQTEVMVMDLLPFLVCLHLGISKNLVLKYQLEQARFNIRVHTYCSSYYENVWLKIHSKASFWYWVIEMPHDETGRKDKPIAAYNNVPSANTDSLCYLAFSSYKGFSITLITLLLFYPRYIFHKQLLRALFLTRVPWVSQPSCIHLLVHLHMCGLMTLQAILHFILERCD